MLFAGVYGSTFQPGNFTGRGNEGVKMFFKLRPTANRTLGFMGTVLRLCPFAIDESSRMALIAVLLA